MGKMYSELLGTKDRQEHLYPVANRAQRRAQARIDRSSQRKGQRAYEATLARKAAIEHERAQADARAGIIRDEIIDFTKKESK